MLLEPGFWVVLLFLQMEGWIEELLEMLLRDSGLEPSMATWRSRAPPS